MGPAADELLDQLLFEEHVGLVHPLDVLLERIRP